MGNFKDTLERFSKNPDFTGRGLTPTMQLAHVIDTLPRALSALGKVR
ncbi:hypothetical protein FVEN_g12741 [Fusarium venenatum]|nr:hypothetical protein FVEN_g12741 [Fusarium venenatum]